MYKGPFELKDIKLTGIWKCFTSRAIQIMKYVNIKLSNIKILIPDPEIVTLIQPF